MKQNDDGSNKDLVFSPFKIQRDVRQKCILSPDLFSIYREHIMRITLEDWAGGGFQLQKRNFQLQICKRYICSSSY